MHSSSSKKTIVFLCILIAIVVVATALTFDYASGKKQDYENPDALTVSDSVAGANVAENTGTDWQEMPWGSAPTSIAPSDTANAASAGNINPAGTTALGVDATDQIGQNFFSQYMNLSQNGAIDTSDDSNATSTAIALAQNVMSQNQVAINYDQFATSSIAVEINETADDIQDYGDELGEIMLQDSPADLQNELTILSNAAQQNDPTVLAGLDTNITAYQSIANSYAALNVPQSALALHMRLLDTLSQLAAADTAMKVFFTDPVTAASGFGLYNSASANLKNIIAAYNVYFAQKHINFSVSSGGYSFTHLAQ